MRERTEIMTEKYKFKDRAWNVTHKHNGEHIDKIVVHADDVREAYNNDKSLRPSTWQDELHGNAIDKLLFNKKLKPNDIDVKEITETKPTVRKSNGGSCW